MSDPAIPFTAEEFALWKHHPVTKVFHQYADDFASALEREALEQWRSGALKLTVEQEMRGRVLTLREIVALSFQDMAAFYQKDEADNAA